MNDLGKLKKLKLSTRHVPIKLVKCEPIKRDAVSSAARDRFVEIFGRSFCVVRFDPSVLADATLVVGWYVAAKRCAVDVELSYAMVKELSMVNPGAAGLLEMIDVGERWRRYRVWMRGNVFCAAPKLEPVR